MRGSDSAPVAQLDRVLGYEPRGRAFESLRAHQQNKHLGQSLIGLFAFHGDFLGTQLPYLFPTDHLQASIRPAMFIGNPFQGFHQFLNLSD